MIAFWAYACYCGFSLTLSLLWIGSLLWSIIRFRIRQTQLISACKEGNVEKIKQLLTKSYVDPNCRNEYWNDGKTLLCLACENREIEIVKILLNDWRVNVKKTNVDGRTPLLIACEKGHTEGVELLLSDQRVEINKTNQNGETPLFISCSKGYFEIVELLLNDQRVDINKARKDDRTPFDIACFNGHIEIVKLLLASERYIYFNLKAALKISNQRSTSAGKYRSETEQEYQNAKKNCPKIVELLESYQRNLNETKSKLREELKYCKIFFIFFSFSSLFTNEKKR